MPVVVTHTVRLLGDHGIPTVVSVHVANGLPGFTIVGQPDGSCRETRDRVRAAILSTDYAWPLERITVDIAPRPQRIPSSVDLAIAVGLLAATDQLARHLVEHIDFVGELGLDGTIRRVPGIVALVHDASQSTVVIPAVQHLTSPNWNQQSVPATSLTQVVDSLKTSQWPQAPSPIPVLAGTCPGLEQTRGNHNAIGALIIAATGRHHLCIHGPAGSGKTMLAQALPRIMPELTDQEYLDVQRVHSAAGLYETPGRDVPFRAPHHTSSAVAMLGGGSTVFRPGELSCAHHGVLLLDDIDEYAPTVLDSFRQPLTTGEIIISRAAGQVALPAKFLLVGTVRPCACGNAVTCRCSDNTKERFQRRVNNALVNRFELHVTTTPHGRTNHYRTVDVREQVSAASNLAFHRQGCLNADLTIEQLDQYAQLTNGSTELLQHALALGSITHRTVNTIRRVARTIADLRGQLDNTLSVDAVTAAFALHRNAMSNELTF
jgi:magnesium chelatase family protein